jgi:alpha-ketoglutarate-dependent taurine dioxygenase
MAKAAVEIGTHPGAWRAASFKSPADYSLALTAEDRAVVVKSVEALTRAGRVTPAHTLTHGDFDFGPLGAKLRGAYEEVRCGRGFVLLRGLPADGLTLDQFIAVVWGIGTYFGRPLSQNAGGELIGHVVDATREDPTPRMYRSNLELRLHSDITTMIGLACWNQSPAGGANTLASGATVHDEIARRARHLLEPLYRGYHYHRLGEEGDGEEPVSPYRVPVFAKRGRGISVRYQRIGIAAAHHALGQPLTETDLDALDLFDEVARDPNNTVTFTQQRGDMVVINNYAVMHARSKFADHSDPERRRHLVRLWLDADGFRDVPREYNLLKTNGVPPQPGKRCTYDFKKLYREDPVGNGRVPRTAAAAAR